MQPQSVSRASVVKGERGAGALFIFVGVMIVAGVAVGLIQYNKITRYQLAQAVAKMELDSAVMSVHRGIRAALVTFPTDNCLPPAMTESAMRAYRRFDTDAPIVEFDLNEENLRTQRIGCLLDKDMIDRLESLKVKISPLQENKTGMQRKVEVVVEAVSKAKNERIVRRSKLARLYQFQPLSISRFGLTFLDNLSDGAFIDLAGDQTKLRVFSNVLYAGAANPTLTQLLASTPERLMFERNNFARFAAVQTYAQDMNGFRLTFRNGLQTSALEAGFVETFLPRKGSANWEQPFDYFPQYNSESYPIPHIPGRNTVSICGPGGTPYDAGRAALDTVPSPGSGPEKTSQTCEAGTSQRAFLFLNASADLTIKFRPDDRNFCGIVVANTLTIDIDAEDPYTYGLIGNFYVHKLVIRNRQKLSTGVSEVRMYNPNDGVTAEGIEPIKQSFDQLGLQFRELASSTGRNFFLPIARDSVFKPWSAADYLRACPAGGTYSYESKYDPFSALTGYEAYQRDATGSLYALEAF